MLVTVHNITRPPYWCLEASYIQNQRRGFYNKVLWKTVQRECWQHWCRVAAPNSQACGHIVNFSYSGIISMFKSFFLLFFPFFQGSQESSKHQFCVDLSLWKSCMNCREWVFPVWGRMSFVAGSVTMFLAGQNMRCERNAFGSTVICIVARCTLLCCWSLVFVQCVHLASDMHLIVAVRGFALMQAMVERAVTDHTEGGAFSVAC